MPEAKVKDPASIDLFYMVGAIMNGTVLPKGHGKLIDADELIKAIEKKSKRLKNLDTINGLCGAVALIYDADAIIEANEEGDTDGNS